MDVETQEEGKIFPGMERELGIWEIWQAKSLANKVMEKSEILNCCQISHS